uniref:Sporulation integral membrane protein YlbJ n=1 Tax=uncultured Bacillota bacterium TaxID=344338 RepID=A0A650ENC0_9FIRM|nr:sporulation integral membrane protein YlbJ [uncultured Firmicutes bacterium]
MNKLQKSSVILTIFCAGFLAAGMILQPQLCMENARRAVELCLTVVIPSLFPFFICSGLFVALGLAYWVGKLLSPVMRPMFRVPGAGALAFVLGIVSGYPVGAKCAVDLYRSGECTKTEAERLLAFCNNSGPLFIMGAVGVGMLQSPQTGRILYLSHVLAALLTGLLFRFYGRDIQNSRALPPSKPESVRSVGGALGEVISNAVDTMLKVCAFVLVFSVFGALLPQTPLRPFVYGLLEITGGIRAWIESGVGGALWLPCISFFLACSGISVLLQVSSIVTPGGLSMFPYALGKLIQGGLSFAITILLLRFLPAETAVFAPYFVIPPEAIPTPWNAFLLSLLMIGWCLLSILILCAAAWLYEKFSKNK